MGRRELVWRVTPHTSQEGRAFAVNVLRWMFADGVATFVCCGRARTGCGGGEPARWAGPASAHCCLLS